MNVLILRDPRESAAKCSLTPLRGVDRIRFVEYHHARRHGVGERILLHTDGEPLGPADRGKDLLLVDCSWRRVETLLRTVEGELVPRRLPMLQTAYPRRAKTFADPRTGLASVEALYAAALLLEGPTPWVEGLLADYRWREEFLAANPLLGRSTVT